MDDRLTKILAIEDPYKKAIYLLEYEAYHVSAIDISAQEAYVDVDKTYCYKGYNTGNYNFFSVTTQHTTHGNILQFINELERKYKEKG